MTEFTPEFIAEQREVIRKGTMTVQEMKANNEIDLHMNMMYRRAKTEHCEKYYPEALDHIERQAQRIAELEQERRWIPVSELSETIRALVYMENDYQVIATYYKNIDKWKNDCGSLIENVIKYQPLPQPPSEEE